MVMNEESKTIIEALEARQVELLKRKKAMLQKEYEVRKQLPMTKINPDFDYENRPEYLAHLHDAMGLNFDEKIFEIDRVIDSIRMEQLQRVETEKEIERMRNK